MLEERAIHKIEQDYDDFRNEMFSLPQLHGCCLIADTESGPVTNKDFIIHGTACRLSFRSKSVFLCPKFPGATWRGGGGFRWTPCVWICVMAENVSLGNL